MLVYKIKNTPSESQYNGCGKAWVAIKEGKVVGIKYMGDFQFETRKIAPWLQAVLNEYSIIADLHTKIEYINGPKLGKIKQAAIAAGYPATGPRGGHIKPSAIAREARQKLQEAERKQFSSYRDVCRDELSQLGDVVSGMCSCYEFVVAH